MKKFDVVLMNPPYDRNLHLKFLEKTISIAENVISVQPVRWLQDPFAKNKKSILKKYEKVARHIESITMLDDNIQGEFDMGGFLKLGIYLVKDSETDFDYSNFWKTVISDEEESIIKKVCFSDKTRYLSDVIEKNKRDGIRVLIGKIGGNRGSSPVYKDIVYTVDCMVGDKDWTESKNMGGYEKPKNSSIPLSIKFSSITEAENFWKSYRNLRFFKVLCDITIQQQNIQLNVLPFLDDYKKDISDSEMYKLFELNDKEINFIENYNIG